jgi:rod shape-determining protein MreC
LLLVVVSLVVMFLDHRQHHLEAIRAGLTLVLSPLQYLVDLPASAVDWGSEALATRESLQAENRTLKIEHLQLKLRMQKLAALEAENRRLRELLQSSTTIGERVLIGELLAVDMDPFKRQVTLNKGVQDGVFAGQALLDAHGVMGQVVKVAPFTSVGMLITDPSHAIPVQVNRTGLRAIALGTGVADRLDIPHLPTNADIEKGDLLITSGLGGLFPPGYPVAQVISVRRDPSQPYASVVAEPTARLERSREVLLVWRREDL